MKISRLVNAVSLVKFHKRVTTLAICALAMGLLLSASTAQATTVEKDGDVATAIRDLYIGSLTYDVTFPVTSSEDTYGPYPGGFDFINEEEAQTATEAVAAVLNGEGGVIGIGPSAANSRPTFRVPFGSVEIPIKINILIEFKVPTLYVWEGVTGDTTNPGVWAVPELSDLFPYGGVGGFAKFTLVAEGSDGNSPPVADAGGPYTGAVGVPVIMSGIDSSDLDGEVVSYEWSAGSGSPIGDQVEYSVTYPFAGTFNVSLTVTDNREMSASDTTTAEIGDSSPPPVADAGGPYHGTVDAPLTFDGTGSSDQDGSIVSYEWTFGDLSPFGSGAEPTHTYTDSGTYSVALEVTDEDGQWGLNYTTAEIAFGNHPPEADVGGPYNGTPGVPITFDGTGSSDQDGSIVLYRWGFGDGSDTDTGTGAQPTHTYIEAGTYSAYLTVDDDDGATDSDGITVVISSGINLSPDCSLAIPSRDTIWPPFRVLVPVDIQGVTDPDGDTVNIIIDSIFQDEPVGRQPDGSGVGTDIALVRAQRMPVNFGGNGRVYHIGFTADDGRGASCSGEVLVGVPLRRGGAAIDGGGISDSTVPSN